MMRHLTEIINEQRLNLDNTEKALIASISISPTPSMAYSAFTGARNSVEAANTLVRSGYIDIDRTNNQATLTDLGKEVLVSDNLTDESGQLTDRGEQLVNSYRRKQDGWKRFESFKYVNSV